MNDRKRILSRRSRTPGKALTKDDLSNVTGGRGLPVPGCCVQGCDPCALPGVGGFPKPGGALPSFP